MGLYRVMAIGSTELAAQRLRMEALSSNLSNVNTTAGPDGRVYQRRMPVFRAEQVGNDFASTLDAQRKLYEVRVDRITTDKRDPIMAYDPGHPDANAEGYVAYPNINTMEEMVGLMSAARNYEANLTAVNAAKEMAKRAIELAG